jgi:hypothetical protein
MYVRLYIYFRGDNMLFRPTEALRTILDITPEMLGRMGIKALLLDVDNTLATHNSPTPIMGLDKWISDMKAHGIKLIIISNNHAERVSGFAESIGIDYIAESAKPLPIGASKALKQLNLPKENICAVGDQIFTDILGANIFGIKSIFVYPIEFESSTPFKIKRFIEKPFIPKKLRKRKDGIT